MKVLILLFVIAFVSTFSHATPTPGGVSDKAYKKGIKYNFLESIAGNRIVPALFVENKTSNILTMLKETLLSTRQGSTGKTPPSSRIHIFPSLFKGASASTTEINGESRSSRDAPVNHSFRRITRNEVDWDTQRFKESSCSAQILPCAHSPDTAKMASNEVKPKRKPLLARKKHNKSILSSNGTLDVTYAWLSREHQRQRVAKYRFLNRLDRDNVDSRFKIEADNFDGGLKRIPSWEPDDGETDPSNARNENAALQNNSGRLEAPFSYRKEGRSRKITKHRKAAS